MQKITIPSLALIASLSLLPFPVFAQDQSPNKEDAKNAEASPHARKGAPHAGKDSRQAPQSRDQKSGGKFSAGSTADASQSRKHHAPDISTSSQRDQQSGQRPSSRGQTSGFAIKGSQSNHYDGRWSSADTHSDWDQQTNHRWRNHDYRWYDGGWLIIDTGDSVGYDQSGSVGSAVQASLSRQGYYHGPVDGEIGRGTRHAIAAYESDNGLPVTGRIDEPLLISLRLQ